MSEIPLVEQVLNGYMNIAEGKPLVQHVFWIYFVYIMTTAISSFFAAAACPGIGPYGVLIIAAVMVRTKHSKVLTTTVGCIAILATIVVALYYVRLNHIPKEWLVFVGKQFFTSPVFWLVYVPSLFFVYGSALYLDKRLNINKAKQYT
ncbi:MAG: hypothetical protein UT42_C0043G0002 [Candidatus Falkowbacteria bacterium GW2011_GWA2_39_24]|uniref:Uncharacterized protein n=1 Tax=Candidatus Falkowbacteria bacterium GW2011_GWA2_39_24 TaxID=1618634 RepID=A0A0G0NLF7_9BACT|nr:MAG: hypothetical protein UT42_C0043G0002 [Candidatus Falkowbacteria bacterium GW2011_GWA2_39_24]